MSCRPAAATRPVAHPCDVLESASFVTATNCTQSTPWRKTKLTKAFLSSEIRFHGTRVGVISFMPKRENAPPPFCSDFQETQIIIWTSPDGISPKLENKCGHCSNRFTYSHKQSMAFMASTFKKNKILKICCGHLLYRILSVSEKHIKSNRINFIEACRESTIFITLIFTRLITAQQYRAKIFCIEFHQNRLENAKLRRETHFRP